MPVAVQTEAISEPKRVLVMREGRTNGTSVAKRPAGDARSRIVAHRRGPERSPVRKYRAGPDQEVQVASVEIFENAQ